MNITYQIYSIYVTGIHNIYCVQVGYHLIFNYCQLNCYGTLFNIAELKEVNDIEDYTYEFICECMYDTE